MLVTIAVVVMGVSLPLDLVLIPVSLLPTFVFYRFAVDLVHERGAQHSH